MSKKWCLVQPKSQKKLYGLSEEDVQLVAYSLDDIAQRTWFAWCEGWENWIPLSELSLGKEPENTNITPPELEPDEYEPMTKVERVNTPDITGNSMEEELEEALATKITDSLEDLDVESTNGEYHFRHHRRLKKRFKVIIEKNGQNFETYSVDISVGGVLLEDPLPDWVVGYSNITIVKEAAKEQVQLTCSVVEGQAPNARFRVELSQLKKLEQAEKFKAWLVA